jgi:hypothetical protein
MKPKQSAGLPMTLGNDLAGRIDFKPHPVSVVPSVLDGRVARSLSELY